MNFPDHECDVIITYETEDRTVTEACSYVCDDMAIVTPIGTDAKFPMACPSGSAMFEDEEGIFLLQKAWIKSIQVLETE